MSTNSAPAVPGVSASILGSLRGKTDRIEAIFNETHQKIVQLVSAPSVSAAATTDEIQKAKAAADLAVAQAKQAAVAALAKLKSETETERDAVLRSIAGVLGRPEPTNPTEMLLRETREGRAWARLKPLLDLAPGQLGPLLQRAKELAGELLAAGDEDSLAALRLELGRYLQGRGLAMDGATAAVQQLDEMIGQARPAVAAALALQREVTKGVAAIMVAINYTSGALERGTTLHAIPNWDGQTSRSLAMPGIDVRTGRSL